MTFYDISAEKLVHSLYSDMTDMIVLTGLTK